MPTLFDMLMRHALYLEGARRGVAVDFRTLIRGLDAEVIRLFNTIPVNNFGELTKADFTRIMTQLRARLVTTFGKENSRFTSIMRDLSDIEVSLFQRIFRADTGQRIAVDNAGVWAKARNREIAA